MIAHTPEDFDLAKKLFAVGAAVAYPGDKSIRFEALAACQADGWIALAQHVHTNYTPRHEYSPAEKGGAS